MSTIMYAANTPLVSDDDDFAYIIDLETGDFYDTAGNFETAVTYIQSGNYVAVAAREWLWHDGTVRATWDEVQRAFDRERELIEDCFGLDEDEPLNPTI